MNIIEFGWNSYFENNFSEYKNKGYSVGRIASQNRNIYKILTEHGEITGEISGKMYYECMEDNNFPAVGDWVVISIRIEEKQATIHNILPRKSKFSRKTVGENTKEQMLAANIDTVFLVNSLNKNFNVRRIERYLVLAWESGAYPVIILSKADLCEDVEEKLLDVESVALGVPVHAISSVDGKGIEEIRKYIRKGETVALLGSSGVGKSTLLNKLAGKYVQEVQDINSENDKGRHTTTSREMIVLEEGGIIIDTPGMRELQLWDGEDGLSETFEDIEELAVGCRFSDCEHKSEPGCAVKQAILEGRLSIERYRSYEKLKKELWHLECKQNQLAAIVEKNKWKSINKQIRIRR